MNIMRIILKDYRAGCMVVSLLLVSTATIFAQSDKKYIRQGNKEFSKGNFPESEVEYRRAIDKNTESPDALFNIGDALYKQEKYEDAGKQFSDNVNRNEEREKKSAGMYNLGNSLLMADKIKESIEAYKNSLRLNPDNPEAKYNLAYAQDLLKQQQQQQQNKDNQENKDNKEDQNKDQQNKENDQQKGQENQQQQQDQQQQQNQQQQSISKEDAERLLNAMANDEKKVQEKVKLARAAKAKVRTVKNW